MVCFFYRPHLFLIILHLTGTECSKTPIFYHIILKMDNQVHDKCWFLHLKHREKLKISTFTRNFEHDYITQAYSPLNEPGTEGGWYVGHFGSNESRCKQRISLLDISPVLKNCILEGNLLWMSFMALMKNKTHIFFKCTSIHICIRCILLIKYYAFDVKWWILNVIHMSRFWMFLFLNCCLTPAIFEIILF